MTHRIWCLLAFLFFVSVPMAAQGHIQQKDTSDSCVWEYNESNESWTCTTTTGGGGSGGGTVNCATTTVAKEKCICACNATFKLEAGACQGTTNERNACVLVAAMRNSQCQQHC